MSSSRIEPMEAPFPIEIAEILSKYPQGPEGPIKLFRTLAHSKRILEKIRLSGLLDRGSPISMKEREIIILRTSARCQCEYEWGVHIAAFSKHVGLTEEQIRATVLEDDRSSVWSESEALIIQLVDQLYEQSGITDVLWEELGQHWNHEQLLEMITLVGFYHTIAFFNNGLKIELEEGAPHFPTK